MIADFAREHARGASDREKAVSLYYAVRDGFRYDPYRIDLSPHGMKPERVLENGYGWCVPKAALLSAACRAVGVPARLGFADVRNHLTTPKMQEVMRTDVFAWHGFSEIFLNGQWLKATPAFNRELCQKSGVTPLEFDGLKDSIFHEYDGGRQHMQYLKMHGSFDDIPLEKMLEAYRQIYPHWDLKALSGDFAP
ncbi:MAG: transglutaminase family protein [Candidatus Eremiobacteraeota bacterium]|nr:transglutaminase family protein [Candidatus Eremiobacteraeota bacterium]MCW5868921.1 transglutaminase family protein [Candidatus Eremiobacteraeota bacterium]